MNKTLLALAVTAVTAVAAPALAQTYDGYRGGYSHRGDDYRRDYGYGQSGGAINQRQAEIERRIERGRAMGTISRQEGWMLRAALRDIEQREWNYRSTGRGLNNWEVADLTQRLDRLAMQVRYERRDRDYGRDRYGYGYGQDRYGYGQDRGGWR